MLFDRALTGFISEEQGISSSEPHRPPSPVRCTDLMFDSRLFDSRVFEHVQPRCGGCTAGGATSTDRCSRTEKLRTSAVEARSTSPTHPPTHPATHPHPPSVPTLYPRHPLTYPRRPGLATAGPCLIIDHNRDPAVAARRRSNTDFVELRTYEGLQKMAR